MKFVFLILCVVSAVLALNYVDCDVNCNESLDIHGAVYACIIDQVPECESCELAVPRDMLLGERAWDALPASATHCGDYSNCSHVSDRESHVCIPYTMCGIDFGAIAVRVYLNGTCDPTMASSHFLNSIDYIGPATFVGAGLKWYFTPTSFTNITFDGNGTAETVFNEVLTSNITMTNCTIIGFSGAYVIKAEADDEYFAGIKLDGIYMRDVSGFAVHVEGLWDVVVRNVVCDNCTRERPEFIHYVLSPLSDGKAEVVDVEIN
jgi:hypothetical protein